MAFQSPPKRRKLSPPEDHGVTTERVDRKGQSLQDDFVKRAAKWNLEQSYEGRPRKDKKDAKENIRLPIKTAEGKVEYHQGSGALDASDGGVSSDTEDERSAQTLESANLVNQAASVPEWQHLPSAKAEMAKIAIQINSDPEENVGGFRKLAQISATSQPKIKVLALATQMAAYKDAIPGYRIRPNSDADPKEKLSKEVRSRHTFEQTLVSAYQNYVKQLAICANDDSDAKISGASVAGTAVSCASHLLLSNPHFNFRGELLKIVVDGLCKHKGDEIFETCYTTLQSLFREDEDGTPSLEAVSMLTKSMRARSYHVDERVLNVLLYLRLLSEFSSKASRDGIDINEDDDGRVKKAKFKKEFRTKKKRKFMKEQKKVEKDLKEADAIVDHEHRDRMQAETLKQVFGSYFRILKERIPHLMGAVLEGLAKYAHLINQDFFGDLLEALKDLINSATLSLQPGKSDEQHEGAKVPAPKTKEYTRSILLCITTAFTLLEGQDAAKSASSLNLDLNFFSQQLYRSLHAQSLDPDIELSAKSLRLPDPDKQTLSNNYATGDLKVNFQTTTALLLRALSAVLTPRSTPPIRLAAFIKQLYTTSLHLPEKSELALLALLNNVAKVHARKIASLWNTEERRGDGIFDPLRREVEGNNPFASTIWEGELLRLHYSPGVRESARTVEKAVASV